RRNLGINGRLFNITRNRAAGNTLELVVNFDHQVIALFKEVRNLLWLGYAVPHYINNLSKEAKRVYPYAVSLMETVRTYTQIKRITADMSKISILLSGYQNELHILVGNDIPLKWDSFIHSNDIVSRKKQQTTYLPNGTLEYQSTATYVRESSPVQF